MKTLLLAALTLTALPSCIVESDRDPSSVFFGSGFAVVDWTIAGIKDPNLCFETGADQISVIVSTRDGFFVGEFQQACEFFATSIELSPGSYIADATMLDARGFEVTTTVELQAFSIFGDDELVLPIDFPFDSFF